MTEAEWLACEDPESMFAFLRPRLSDRKLRLVACAIIRHAPFHPDGRTVWDLLPAYTWFSPVQPGHKWSGFNAHQAIAVSEKEADGEASMHELEATECIGSGVLYCAESATPLYTDTPIPGCWQAYTAAALVRDVSSETSRLRQRLLGFRGVFREACPSELHTENGAAVCTLFREVHHNPFRKANFAKKWRTSTGVALAKQMYESRDFGAMPILADALQDAGCDSDDILSHCRDAKQVHVRGCWVVDLVLGKE